MLNAHQPQFHEGYECLFKQAYHEHKAEVIYEASRIICEKKQNEPFWRFREDKKGALDADLAESLESYQERKWLSAEQVKKLPHELVCQALSGNTRSDVPLSSIQVLPGDPSNRYTPDIIWNTEPRFFWVVEVKTSLGDSAFMPRQRILRSYDSALQRRSQSQGISLSMVVVTMTTVFSDVAFTQREVDKLVSLHVFGRMLKEMARNSGYVEDDSDESFKAEVINILTSLSPNVIPGDSELIITPELMSLWKTTSLDCSYQKHFLQQLTIALKEGKPRFPEPELRLSERKSPPHVLKWPLIQKGCKEDGYPTFTRQDTLLGRVWLQALQKCNPIEHNVDEEFVLIPKEKRFRVELKLSDQDWFELSLSGVRGKRFRKEAMVLSQHKKSKIPISEDANVSAIDDFITRSDLHQVFNMTPQPLIRESVDDDSLDLEALYTSSQGSAMGDHMEVITRISEELNISRRQVCKKDHFVLKWLPSIGIWLLIRPTNSKKPIFFSVLYRNEIEAPLVFRSGEHLGDGWKASRFTSLNSGKLANLMSCSSLWPSLRGTFSLLYNSDVSTPSLESDKLATLTMVMFMENKLCTSKDSLQLRHLYMEFLSHDSQPYKVFKKFHPQIRSSLQLWFIQKMRLITRAALSKKEGKARLLSFIDLKPFSRLEQCLNVMYLGSTYNKFQGETIHGFLKIFNKVIQQEVLLDTPSDARTGLNCGQKSHEFCPETVKAIGDCIREQMGKRGMTMVMNQIYKDLWEVDWDYFSTTKASAIKPDTDMFSNLDKKANYRRKCMSAVQDLMREFPGKKPIQVLPELLKKCETESLNVVNLFRKPQHGGDREIFVLHIVFRVCIYYLERIARTIAGFLPGEMLTKPKEKAQIAVDHFKFVLRDMEEDKERVTVINSSDAATWCQRFVMTEFGLMLSRVLPEHFHVLIMRVLNLVTTKKLMLPVDLLSLFIKNPEVESTSPEMQRLKMDFFNGGSLLPQGGVYLRNLSNMMQGILHYNSTILHWGLRCLRQKLTPLLENIVSRSMGAEAKLKYSYKVSSDDSSTHQTMSGEGISRQNKERWLVAFSVAEALAMRFGGAEHSFEKSAMISRMNVEEFNSKWYEGSSTSSIVIKFILRCLQIPCNGSPVDRQLLLSNLRTALVSEGSGFRLAALMQMSQNELYYRYLGAHTNEAFKSSFERMREVGHPRLGAFVAEPSLCAGMLGFEYALFRRLHSNPLAMKHEQWLFKERRVTTLDEENLSGLMFRLGDNKKFNSFLSDAGFDVDQERSWLNENYEKMYDDSVEAKVKLQFLSPSLPQAFKPVDTSETAALSVYYWSDKVFHVGWAEEPKTSLAEALLRAPESEEPLNELARFPLLSIYQSMDELLSTPKTNIIYPGNKKRYTSLNLSEGSVGMNINDLIRWVWFKDISKVDLDLAETCWQDLKNQNPWLKDTYQDTMESVKAADHVQLKMLLMGLKHKRKNILILSPAKKAQNPMLTMMNLVAHNQDPNNCKLFQMKGLDSVYENYGEVGKGLHDEIRLLSMISNGPDPDKDINSYLRNYPVSRDHLDESRRLLPIDVQAFIYLAYWLTHPGSINTYEVKRLRGGFVGGFTQRQRFDGVGWRGVGKFVLNFNDFSCLLTIKDQSLVLIETDHIDFLRLKTGVIRDLVDDMRLTLIENNSPDCHHWNTRDGVTIRSGVDVRLSRDLPVIQSDHLRVEYKDKAFRLIALYDNIDERRKQSVVILRARVRYDYMTYRPPPEEMDLNFMDYLSDCWVKSKPLTLDEINEFIRPGDDSLVEWAVECIRARRAMTKHSFDDRVISQASFLLGEDQLIEDQPAGYSLDEIEALITDESIGEILKLYGKTEEEREAEEEKEDEQMFAAWNDEEVETSFGFVRRYILDRSIGLNSMFDELVDIFDEEEKRIKIQTRGWLKQRWIKQMIEIPCSWLWLRAFPLNDA